MRKGFIKMGVLIWACIALVLIGIFSYALATPRGSFLGLGKGLGLVSTESVLIQERSFSLADRSRLSVKVPSHKLVVRLVEGDTITLRQYGDPNQENPFEADEGPDSLAIHIPNRIGINFNFGETRMEVDLPKDYALDVELSSVSGSVEVPSVAWRNVNLHTTSGSLRLNDIQCSSLNLGSVSGSVNAENLSVLGDATLGTTSGSIRIKNLVAHGTTATSVSGSIHLEALDSKGKFSTTSGSIRISSLNMQGDVTASSISGSVKLALAGNQSYNVEIDTVSGGIHTQLPLSFSGLRKNHATGTVGEGGKLLSISTTSGGVNLE